MAFHIDARNCWLLRVVHGAFPGVRRSRPYATTSSVGVIRSSNPIDRSRCAALSFLSESTTGGYHKYTYGRADQNGLPVIEPVKRDNQTAYVEHDPVTGEALMLRASTGMQSLYVYDGTGNPAVLVTSTAYPAFAHTDKPLPRAGATIKPYGGAACEPIVVIIKERPFLRAELRRVSRLRLPPRRGFPNRCCGR